MPLSSKDVENIAHLARLRFAENEVPAFTDNLSRIIDFVNQLEAAPVGDAPPMAHPLDQPQRLRKDVVTEKDQRAEFQKNAAAIEAGLYLVPRVIE
ncbi:MAG: Asp-tRNA(Asn)/Glu-tRNA(Gln) amidotransferase subunit GatC [Gammaproteobacteria bacterium]|nr:Asp-tRNA(Asn)/Glu-tRNA(Gln) amidotransferase subunit GatC [Gammaproteobacteria bacterium]